MSAEWQGGASGAESVAPSAANTGHYGHGHHGDGKLKLAVGAIGVVFGDIGTSPLYAFRETFAGHHPIEPDRLHIYGVLSLVFWSMMLVVTFKYVMTIMKADNKGEGGSLALLALISRSSGEKRWTWPIILLGVFATALFYGDSMITPAMSVLSATEGLRYIDPGFAPYIVPIALGAVVLAVTGAEALYADMGHFGRGPIGLSWLTFVLPALMLNYMGQGAMVLDAERGPRGDLIADPFFQMMPDAWQVPVVILAILATIIASQAVISGAFSLTQQAIQLGFIPRLRVEHTSASAAGQIYIPVVNWFLMIMVIILVLFFGSSSNLAAAYGIAVTGAMFIDTCLLSVVLFTLWKWPAWKALPVLAVFFIVDIAYFGANLIKVPDGGWVPLAIGLIIFTLLTTWSRGRKLMQQEMAEGAMPIPVFVKSAANSATRVPGTAVFMTSSSDGVPHALLHNLKHNKVLHARIILLTIKIADVPFVQEEKFCLLEDLGQGFHRLVLNYGFMQPIDVPEALTRVTSCGGEFKMLETSFFLSRQTLIAASKPGMPIWREKLFAWMLRNSESAMEYFRLPTNRVVELGSQVAI